MESTLVILVRYPFEDDADAAYHAEEAAKYKISGVKNMGDYMDFLLETWKSKAQAPLHLDSVAE